MKRYQTLITATLCTFSMGANADVLFDFEDGKIPTGGWGTEKTIIENPHLCGNTSAHVLRMEISNYGGASFACGAEIGSQKLAVDILAPTETSIKAYSNKSKVNLYQTAKAGVWNTLYFDFTDQGLSSDEVLIALGGESGMFYMDNIRFVSDQNDAVKCTQAMKSNLSETIPYSYGTLAIGGGGFVSGIIASGKSKYARTDVGGAYRWNDADCSWKPISNFVSEENKGLLSIEALAIDPQDEKHIFLLGGCQYFSSQKTAVMYSTDGGETFTTSDVTSLIFAHGNGQGRNCGERIAVDPNNSDIIFCGGRANNPLIKSTNGGESWEAVAGLSDVYTSKVNWPSWESKTYPSTPDQNGTTAVVFDGSKKSNGKTQRIFVGISRTNASNVYVSEDAGTSWNAVAGLPTNYIPCRMKMDPDGNLLIAYSSACVGGVGDENQKIKIGEEEIWPNAGAIYRYNPNTQKTEDISPEQTYHRYAYGDVAVSPKDANKLVVSTNNTWIPQAWDNGSRANGDIYWTSEDGGKTWRSLRDNMTLTNNGVTWIPGYAIHWSGSLCFDPTDDNKISTTSGNGIFTCNNIWCQGKPTFYFDVNGLEETVALDMVSVPGGDLMSVIGDYTGFIHKDIHEFAPIHDPAPGTTGGINYYSKDPKVMMRVANTGFFYTTTGHEGWKQCASVTPYLWKNPYYAEADPLPSNEGKCAITKVDGKYRFFIIPGPGESGIYYSDNNGSNWTKISGTDKATHMQVDPENDAYVYAGGKGTFYVSKDYGKTFQSSALSNGDYGRIAIVPGKEGIIYAPGASNGLYVSDDHGSSFSKIANVSNCEAVGTGIGKSSDYVIYIWGAANHDAIGLYSSEDYGKSWQRINDEEHQFGGPGNGQFVVGDWNTYGRFYMSTVGLGIIYGERAENATSSTWKCFVDNTDCKVEGTEIEEVEAPTILLYPNPFDESFNFTAEGEYEVLNTLGQVIEQGEAQGTVTMGQTWKQGLYILKMNDKATKIMKK